MSVWSIALILVLAFLLETSDISRILTLSFGVPPRSFDMAGYDQFILFGDSLFQHSSDQVRGFGMHSALQAGMSRRLAEP